MTSEFEDKQVVQQKAPDGQKQPIVIARSDHPISRKNIDREALKVMYRLRDAGFSAYLVGGGVRDIYLGKPPKDFDISTNARPGQLRKLFRNSRVIGRRFRLVQVFFAGNKIVEVSTFRCQGEYDIDGKESVLPANNTFGTPAEDAFRRDLTINGLFYEIENYTVIDYVGGVQDLKDKIVRIVGDPEKRIVRDPVRMMRAIRHAARAEFKIEQQTWDSICRHHEKLLLCPVSRIHDELLKDLQGGASRAWAALAKDSGIFAILFPFYLELFEGEFDSQEAWDELLALLGVVDRLAASGTKLSTSMLFALLFIPWAKERLALMDIENLRRAYEMSQKARQALTDFFGRLNIKRATQDESTRYLVTLPLLVNHSQGKGWPKWLKKKSYFQAGLHLYKIYREAKGGEQVATLPEKNHQKRHPAKNAGPPNRRSSGGKAPAFAHKSKSGVFGLRKRKRR